MEGFMIFLYVAIGIFILATIGGIVFGYLKAFYSPTKRIEHCSMFPETEQAKEVKGYIKSLIEEMNELEFEEVWIKSYDGTMLFGRYYHFKDGAPIEIQFHGYKGFAIRDFCGAHKLVRQMGHNILLVDQRAHGISKGHTICFGVKERYDCLCWANYLYERFGENVPVFLTGVSMGGATVLMASELDLPKNVAGVIADCPFSSAKEIIKSFMKNMGLPIPLAYPATYMGAILFGHFRFTSASAYTAVQNTNLPILMFHGTGDTIVPYEMGKKIFDVCSSLDKFFYTFEGAEHGMSFTSDPERYTKAYGEFVDFCLDKFKAKQN